MVGDNQLERSIHKLRRPRSSHTDLAGLFTQLLKHSDLAGHSDQPFETGHIFVNSPSSCIPDVNKKAKPVINLTALMVFVMTGDFNFFFRECRIENVKEDRLIEFVMTKTFPMFIFLCEVF